MQRRQKKQQPKRRIRIDMDTGTKRHVRQQGDVFNKDTFIKEMEEEYGWVPEVWKVG